MGGSLGPPYTGLWRVLVGLGVTVTLLVTVTVARGEGFGVGFGVGLGLGVRLPVGLGLTDMVGRVVSGWKIAPVPVVVCSVSLAVDAMGDGTAGDADSWFRHTRTTSADTTSTAAPASHQRSVCRGRTSRTGSSSGGSIRPGSGLYGMRRRPPPGSGGSAMGVRPG